MWWADESSGESDTTSELVAFAEQVGMDHSLSREVVAAVYSFCRQRHGTTELSGDYLRYLTLRSSLVSVGSAHSGRIMDGVMEMESIRDPMLFRTLAGAADASTTYEAYRRGLVRLIDSDLSGCGYVLLVDFQKVTVPPEQDVLLFWSPVCKRVAAWLSEWRRSNTGARTVVIRGVHGRGVSFDVLKNHLSGCIESVNRESGLPPPELIWHD